jgi:hypothetical protein
MVVAGMEHWEIPTQALLGKPQTEGTKETRNLGRKD